MRESTLTFTSSGHTLQGTLTLPDGDGPFPAALVVPGSGPVDRDSNHKQQRLDVTRQLAETLSRAGLATLRYDKRGVGQSTGDFLATGFLDNADDVEAALAALASSPAVDPGRVVVVGHSEGALLATIVAARSAVPAGVVLLSGSATPGEELLRWQARQIAPTLPALVRLLVRVLPGDLESRVAKNHRRIKATTTDVARIGGPRVNARWTREFMAYDPRPDLARLTVPVLAVTGGKDLQTKPEDLAVIAETVPGPVETHEVPDVSHLLRHQAGPASIAAYKKEIGQPLDTRVLAFMSDWTVRLLAPVAP
ncbi:alpha/beta hydrolase family protein [Georgenia sp. H159]|uniref:alpha/beta hydrolase family protein n=1 Tax=Georgenia sp. H159 TaxID=3076115 RepID=UPI002D78E4B2|nr:alpha/beta fold hydrolase [Georgenia sp. H159]